MNIQVKSPDQCIDCLSINKFPPCGVTKFHEGLELSEVINRDFSGAKNQQYLLCPSNAIQLKGSVAFVDDKCVSCGLCSLNCPYDNIEILNNVIEENILPFLNTEILKIASFISAKFKGIDSVTTEVKTEGNSRNRRIDIVVHKGECTMLIKLFSLNAGFDKYSRAYTDILSNLSNNKLKNISVVFLITEERKIFNQGSKDINKQKVNWVEISIDNLNRIL